MVKETSLMLAAQNQGKTVGFASATLFRNYPFEVT
jgi:hypothetical protein